MEMKKKIIFFIVTTLILGTITFLIIRNLEKKNETGEENKEPDTQVVEATIEEMDYDGYLEYRSQAHETETYAIVIWNSQEEVSKTFLEEVKVAFSNRKSVVYLFDINGLSKEDYSRVIDDVTTIMKHKDPQLLVPTIIVMSKGQIAYSHEGLIYKEELMENLNAKSIE